MLILKYHIPNILTCGNLICGCIGIDLIEQGDYVSGVYWMFLAAIFDFFDGFAARLLNRSLPVGKELDSLADIVSFGVLPTMLMMCILAGSLPDSWQPLKYAALLIAVFSALRLAKFNLDVRQKDAFIGLPTPASALFFGAFPFVINSHFFFQSWFASPIFQLSAILFISFLMLMEFPLLSLKSKNFTFVDNKMRILLIGTALSLFILLGFVSIPFIIVFYVLLSVLNRVIN